ncbi:MAG: glycoside hydrolase family 3 protein [Cytophagales bacterium]|nr:glycoside hydrolase family 3 protein [Cytophagales bacterium]
MKKLLLWVWLLPCMAVAQTDSLDIKIGQMIMMGLDDFTKLDKSQPMFRSIQNGMLGGVILFEKHINKRHPFKQLNKITKYIQEIAPSPVLISIDEEGGRVNRLKPKYGFPWTISAQCLGDLDNQDSTQYYTGQSARMMMKLGINMNLAPNVDVNINPNNPVIGNKERSYSEDYKLVTKHADLMVDEQKKYGLINVLKHFPGHGSSASDTHLGIADVSSSWKWEELFPYRSLIDSGNIQAIMTAHIVNERLDESRKPATLSKKIMTELLRDFMGYKGVIISDDLQMHAISKHFGFEEAIVLSINAGVDILTFANNTELTEKITVEYIHGVIKKSVLNGEISTKRINESFQRINKLKKELL